MRLTPVGLILVAGACTTESLYICVNCGTLRAADLRGSYQVVLTASGGSGASCNNLQVIMADPISWDGCFSPAGGSTHADPDIVRLSFVDSAGTEGALEFYGMEGTADSATASWRSTCLKTAPGGTACGSGTGTASWRRTATGGTADPEPALRPQP